MAAWRINSLGNFNQFYDISVQRFNSQGQAVGAPALAYGRKSLDFFSKEVSYPDVTELSDGRVLVTWQALTGDTKAGRVGQTDTSERVPAVLGQIYHPNGTADGDILQLHHGKALNVYRQNESSNIEFDLPNPLVTSRSGGGFVLSMQSLDNRGTPRVNASKFAQRY